MAKIVFLGWGSLIWEPNAKFDKRHDKWRHGGPVLKIEFSRISSTRGRALTLVIDPTNGVETPVLWSNAMRKTLKAARKDLAKREECDIDRIHYLNVQDDPRQGETEAEKRIRAWAVTFGFDTVVWTGLTCNFHDKRNVPFSVSEAIKYIQSLLPADKSAAAEYLWRAPCVVQTPVRATFEVAPWFGGAKTPLSPAIIDPRTLQPVVEFADCHILPDWCGVSGLTVHLDKKTDNDLGAATESTLKEYLAAFLSRKPEGTLVMKDGLRPLNATFDIGKEEVVVVAPRKSSGFAERNLGAKDGEAVIESFNAGGIDGHLAGISAIHSAFLLLYRHGREDLFAPRFDRVRSLLASALAKALTDDDRDVIAAMVKFEMAGFVKAPTGKGLTADDLRDVYDPNADNGDEVATDFPNKSIMEQGGNLVVTLPYSGTLRAHVLFAD